ncbi:RCC1 and BTB domain-containing protein 2 [Podila horticola]|nr:RCC1 and BTB domain-containing protein 2 [Podila horticola]
MFIARIGGIGCKRPCIGGRSVLSWNNTTSRNTPIVSSRRISPTFYSNTNQIRPFLSWLFNPKEDPIVPKQLNPLKLDDQGLRLLFWDSTYTTPHLKPEFNDGNIHVWGSNYYSQVGLTTESFHDDDSEEITDVHFVNQLANEEIVQVASGNFHNLALSSTGKLWSWGSGCLGRGDEIYDSLPQPVEFFHALGRDIKQVFAAGNYSMALVTPKNGDDDELYVWGYIPFGEADENGQVVPVMKKSLRPLLVTSVLGYKISHVACSPWHFTLAATPATSTSGSLEKPFLMTFGRYSDDPVLEKPFSPLFLDIPPEDEFYETKPWRTFRSVSASSDLVIKKIAASKGCDIVLMENGSVGVSDHEDHVARLIHRRLDVDILDVAGGSSEVIAISSKGEVMSWSEPLTSSDSSSNNDSRQGITSNDSLQARLNLKDVKPSELHPLQDFNKDQAKAETEVLAFFDTQKRGQPKQIRLVEALFESSRLVVEKPGLSKCVAQYDRFTIC